MSFVARRLSVCLPQETLIRRSSPTAHDIASQISQFEATCPNVTERNSSAVQQETSKQLLDKPSLVSSAGTSPPLSATGRTKEVFQADRQRDSLRSPAWRLEPVSPATEFLLQQSILQRGASSSPKQRFFGRGWRLDEEQDEGESQITSPEVQTPSPHPEEILPFCPTRKQRRQSWGPALFTPSPVSTSPVQAGHTVYRHDFLSPIISGQQRRLSLGTAGISLSPKETPCFQLHDAVSPIPSLVASSSLVSPHYRVTNLPATPLKSPCEEDGEADKEDRQSRSVESGNDAVICEITRNSNKVPQVTVEAASLVFNRSLEARLAYSQGDHSEGVKLHPPGKFFCAWEQNPTMLTAHSRRRASWHTTLVADKTCVSPSHSHRYQHDRSPTLLTASRCPQLPSRLHCAGLGSILGKGGFGVVKLGRYRGCDVAVKVLKGQRAAASSRREAKVLPLAPHAHLAWTLAVVTHAAKGFAKVSWSHVFGREEEMVSQQTVTTMFSLPSVDTLDCPGGEHPQQQGEGGAPWWAWVVSELCLPQTLLTLINNTSLTLTSEMRVRYILDISRGLAHLHASGLAHRDIKPGNVLLTQSGHLKIADFGCCARLDLQDDDTVLGTVRYQAPEVLRGAVGGSHSDMFSLGVTIWHLLTRSLPYQGLHPHIVIYQVAYLNHRPPDHQPHHVPRTFLDAVLWRLAHTCWSKEHSLRPTAAALCKHLTLLHLAPSPSGIRGLPSIKVWHLDSPISPVAPHLSHPPGPLQS